MDLQPIHQQEATSISSTPSFPQEQQSNQISSASASSSLAESRALRSSARVKAAKQKEKEKGKGKEREPESDLPSSSSAATPSESVSRITRATAAISSKPKRTRDRSSGKGKAKEVSDDPVRPSKRARRTTLPPSAPLTINDSVRDPKGKKRAVPEENSEEEPCTSTSSIAKRPRTSSYSLRSRTDSTLPKPLDMPRKPRSTLTKGKMAIKSKAMAPSSSRLDDDEDVEMLEAEFKHEDSEPEDHVDSGEHDDEGDGGGPGSRNEDGGEDERALPPDGGRDPSGPDENAAMAIFGDYRQFGSYMVGLSSRLKTMLNNIKLTADPTTRLVTLQELSELLSISTEDTLAGSFQVEQFVKELVMILGGRGVEEDEDDDGGEDRGEQDEDAALAAALAMSTGGTTFQGDDNLEAQVLACRCLANLMEALPGVAHTVVYHGAIPVLCRKLIEISYIDLAEQTLSTLEKISEEFPSSIVREGGLAALLNYLDFFSIAVQRTALQAASNCCRNVSPDHFPMIRGVWPIIRNCLAYSDQRLVEFACLCVIRVIDSYYRTYTENLESLVDADLIRAVNVLLLPAGGSPLIAPNTYTLFLRALATSARASPKITMALLEADIVDTLYQILTGVLPSTSGSGDDDEAADLGGGLADMTVMDNLAHRPKDQVEEALSLISELMPPLPKDGIFDHKSFTEKSLARMMKAKAKAERAAARQASAPSVGMTSTSLSTTVSTPTPVEGVTASDALTDQAESQSLNMNGDETAPNPPQKEPSVDRMELLRSKPVVVGRFMQLIVPILSDVYAASVATPVRVKSLTGLLKAVSFLEGDGVKRVLKFVPVASFASSILSSKDHLSLVIGVLQLVDLLLTKVPIEYKPTFRREGVFHEIEALAIREVTSSKSKDKDKEPSEAPSPGDSGNLPVPTPASTPSAASTIPGFKKLTSLSLDPEDAVTLRARVIRFKHLADADEEQGDNTFERLQSLVERLASPDASEKGLTIALKELADLFSSPHTSVSSFELLRSGVVDALLQFTTDKERNVTVKRRQEIFLDAFTTRRARGVISAGSPFSTIVKKLQESLTRMESFEVVTVTQGVDADSKRSSPSLLARQLRLRLVAGDDSDIPRNLHNIVVSIHAIATFQALHDYLRPRVSGLLSSGSRLSGMLAALAASGFGPGSSQTTTDGLQGIQSAPPPEDSNAATAGSSTGSAAPVPVPSPDRRRSLRLSVKNAGSPALPSFAADDHVSGAEFTSEVEMAETSAPDFPVPESSGMAATPTLNDNVIDSGLAAEFTDDEIDAEEVFEDDVDPDNSVSEKTVTLSVAEDGSKVEAQTPDGTRVATPNSSMPPVPMTSESLSTRTTYAAALKAKPSDWHLEFSMDDQVLPLDLTIYGAIHQHEMRKQSGPLPPSLIWQGVYTITFKKVSGPSPSAEARTDGLDTVAKNRSPSPTITSLPEDAPHAKILRLLRVLHRLNTLEGERTAFIGDKRTLSESTFINNKLTAKLTRQLEEPMIVASSCLPDWALDLPQHFPFLFPFATRYNFLQSTSFGYARLILKWQSQQSRGQDTSRRDEGIGFLGRLQRQKVRISRKHILESAVKVFELYGSSSSVLEVEYFEEVGTGLGPTLEFYSLVSKEFARRDLKIWRDGDATRTGPYVHHPDGLFPCPIRTEDIVNDGGLKRTHIFRVIGQFVAKAMLDSRIIDLHFNKIFLKFVLGEEVPLTIASLKLVDRDLANSLSKLQGFALLKGQTDKFLRKVAMIEQIDVEDLALDFTIPGYDIELRPGGRDIQVTSENMEDYIHEVLDAIIGKGAQLQAKAFRDGFSKVFPISDLQAFSADELVMLFGNSDEDWSTETLSEALRADHGFNVESRAIRDLIEIISDYDVLTRRDYLQFITGSPKLPIGGFRGLNPPLTVVRKPHEAPLTADDYLPSVMTCVNYLKLPEYSSKVVMREKLRTAIREGVGSFHLS